MRRLVSSVPSRRSPVRPVPSLRGLLLLLLLLGHDAGVSGEAFAGSLLVDCFGLLRPRAMVLRATDAVLPLRLEGGDGNPTVFLLGRGEALRCHLDGGEIVVEAGADAEGLPARRGERLLTLEGQDFECAVEGVPRRLFRGRLELRPQGTRLLCRLLVSESDYVAGVVAAETDGACLDEALAALAVVLRTGLARDPHRHGREAVTRCDSTHCALFRGRGDGSAEADALFRRCCRAVDAVGDARLEDGRGRPWPVFFAAACGGATVPAAWAWRGGEGAGELGRPCPACALEPMAWTTAITAKRLAEIFFPDEGGDGPLRLVLAHAGGDYVRQVLLVRGGRRRRMTGEAFRIVIGRRLGWNRIRSNRFRVRRDGEGADGTFRFEGRGFGHGVGLCQAAARHLADQGFTWRQILRHAFPRARLR